FLVEGEAGVGRSRMLDAFVLEAKLAGMTAARAGTSSATAPFGVAAAVAAQLYATAPTTALAAARMHPDVAPVLLREATVASGDTASVESRDAVFVDFTRPDVEQA